MQGVIKTVRGYNQTSKRALFYKLYCMRGSKVFYLARDELVAQQMTTSLLISDPQETLI